MIARILTIAFLLFTVFGRITLGAPLDSLNQRQAFASAQIILSQEELENSFGTDWRQLLLLRVNELNEEYNYRGQWEPLIVLDGVPMPFIEIGWVGFFSLTPESFLNSAEIEEIALLKGLQAEILYGEQGRAGALLISTKKKNKEKGWQRRISSGVNLYQIHSEGELNLQRTSATQSAQLSYSNGKHGAYIGYTSQYDHYKDFGSENPQAMPSPLNGWDHQITSQFSGQLFNKLAIQAGGTFRKPESNITNGRAHFSMFYPVNKRLSLQVNAGTGLDHSHFKSPINPQYFDVQYLYVENKKQNSDIRANLKYQLPISYKGITVNGLFLNEYQKIYHNKSYYDTNVEGERIVNDDEIDLQLLRQLTLAEIRYKNLLIIKTGAAYQTIKDPSNKVSSISPYFDLELDIQSFIPWSKLSSLQWQFTYGNSLGRPSDTNPEIRRKAFRNGVQSYLQAGFNKDRFTFTLGYYRYTDKLLEESLSDKNGFNPTFTNEYEILKNELYEGAELLFFAQVFQNDAFYWKTGIQAFAYLGENAGGLKASFINHLAWNNLSLSSQLARSDGFSQSNYGGMSIYGSSAPYKIIWQLQSVSFGYTLPEKWIKTNKIEKVTLALNGRNIPLTRKLSYTPLWHSNWGLNCSIQF